MNRTFHLSKFPPAALCPIKRGISIGMEDLSINVEGNVSQTKAENVWHQSGRAARPQEKEKDAPQPKAKSAVEKQ